MRWYECLTSRQCHFNRKEPECRIATLRHIAPTFRQLRLPLHLQPRHKRLAHTIGRMAEFELRHTIFHPEARNLEVVVRFRRIDTKHEAYSDLFKMRG